MNTIVTVLVSFPWVYYFILLLLFAITNIQPPSLFSVGIIEIHRVIQTLNISAIWEFQQQYGEFSVILIYSVLLSMIIKWRSIQHIFDPLISRKIPNNFAREIQIAGKSYIFEIGSYSLSVGNHPSLETSEPYKLYEDGTISRSDYIFRLKEKLTNVLQVVEKYPYISVSILKNDDSNGIYLPFSIYLYSIIPTNRKSHCIVGKLTYEYIQRNPKSLTQIMMYDPNFTAVKLNTLSSSQFRKMVNYNPFTNQFSLGSAPPEIRKLLTNYSFQLGVHEIDVLNEIFQEFLKKKRNFEFLPGKYYLGKDFQGLPAYCENPHSILQFGSEDFSDQILNFSFIEQPIVLTDDVHLISTLDKQSEYFVQKVDIDNLAIDLFAIKKLYPRSFWLILHLWEQMLANTGKNEYRSALLSPKIHAFLEQYEVLHPEDENSEQFLPVDLFQEKTFAKALLGKQENGLATQIWTKFSGILDLMCFNQNAIAIKNNIKLSPLDSFLSQGKGKSLRVIDLSTLTSKQKYAIITLFMVLKDQAYEPLNDHWLYISIKDESTFQEDYLSELRASIEFQQIVFHLRTVGNLSSWVHGFGMYVSDTTALNEDLMDYFYPEFPKISEGLLVNVNHTSYTILQEHPMGGFSN